MKYFLIALFLICTVFTIGCSSQKYYSYDVSMTYPKESKQLFFENDTFSVTFNLNEKAIETFIYNKSNSGIRINWDEVSFSINGKTYRAVHAQTALRSINDVQPPTTIPPRSQSYRLFGAQ